MKIDEGSPKPNPEEYCYLSAGNGRKASNSKLEQMTSNQKRVLSQKSRKEIFMKERKRSLNLAMWRSLLNLTRAVSVE